MVGPGAGIREEIELGVGLDQAPYLGSRAGHGQSHGNLTDSLVALVPPGPSFAADWEKYRQRQEDVACSISYSKIHLPLRLEFGIPTASARRDKGMNY